MNPPRKSTRSRKSGFRLLVRLFGWSVSAVVALVVLLYLALPAMLRFGVPHALERYGLVSSVDGARIDLADETLTLVGFHVGFEDGPSIRWGEVMARVDTAALLKGNIRIKDFEVKDARVHLETLRASDWNPPARLAAIPELGGLNVDIGDVVLRDVKFIGLSERLGRAVELRSLEIGGLSHLGSGEHAVFRLEGRVGEAAVRLAGRARLENGLPAMEGRYEVGGLNLAGLGGDTARLNGGRLDSTGTFTLNYAGEGTVETDLSGRAGVVDLAFESAGANIVAAAAQWEGDLRAAWPFSGESPRITARGRASSPRIRSTRETPNRSATVQGRGLEWDGELRYAGAVTLDGAVRGESLELRREGPAGAELHVQATGVAAEVRRSVKDGAAPLEVPTLTVERAEFAGGQSDGFHSAVLFDAVIADLRAGAGVLRVGRLAVENTEATVTVADAAAPARLNLIALEAHQIVIEEGAGWRLASLEVEQSGLALDAALFRSSGARLENVMAGPGDPVTAETITAATARRIRDGQETWVEEMRLDGVALVAPQEFRADALSAGRLSLVVAEVPLWEASGVRARDLGTNATEARVSSLELDGLVHGRAGSELFELKNARASEVVLGHGARIDATRLSIDALHYLGGGIAMLEARSAEIGAPGLAFDGGFAADFVESDQIRHTDAAANLTVLENIHAGALSGDLSRGMQIDAVHADDVSHDRGGGVIYRARGVGLSRVDVSEAGDVSAAAAKLASVESVLPDETKAELDQIALARPRWREGGAAAQGASIRTARLTAPGGSELRIADVDVGAVTSAADGHHLDALRAGDLQARHPGSGARLDGDTLELSQVSWFSDGRLRVGTGRVEGVALRHGDGARPGSVSAAAVGIKGMEAGRGNPLKLEDVNLHDAALELGIDAAGDFLLPPWPIFGSGEESPPGIVIGRLETARPGRMKFFDRSTDPEFRLIVAPLTARLEGFASGDPNRRARFAIDGQVDSFSNIKAEGTIALAPGGVSLELSGRVTGFELQRLNTYAARESERDIRGGRGDASVQLAIRDGRVSGSAELTLSNVVFASGAATPPAEDGRGEAGGDMTLYSTLSMLKDKNDTVRLTVPLSGSLDDPRFDLSDIFIRALMRTLRNTVELTFKPLGLLVSATGIMSGSRGPGFKPVPFEAGESALSGQGLTYLDTLAGQLEQHPAVEVEVCGRAVPADRIVMEQPGAGSPDPDQASASEIALDRLAAARAAMVRRYLEEQHRIPSERLHACTPRVETSLGRLPRVDLPVRVEVPTKPAAETATAN